MPCLFGTCAAADGDDDDALLSCLSQLAILISMPRPSHNICHVIVGRWMGLLVRFASSSSRRHHYRYADVLNALWGIY